ncbi:DUF418 domain-containing protein [Heyndrickxia acidicola]|uniref:DUF418 domain-containing protein n=1 Tax=Heyndrickxia acidicola TaxID=209389 RepID=A0ABU6MFM6_9BACI|nr:DUF418 domain-containing protein [Heyndrickxia acidicola]MED1202483.1 DUF418 domain-containing protein [Heyndrickxia acidicola]
MRPIEPSNRILSLDILRGFSLLGIYIVNMISFHSPFLYYDPLEWWRFEEKTAYEWIEVLAESSFYPIFAMMFGYGLSMIRDRVIQKSENYYRVAVRRLVILLCIGCIHAFLIWSGDILITYAICGLLVLGFLKYSGKTLLFSGIALFLFPNLLFGLYLLWSALVSPNQAGIYADITNIQSSISAYGSGGLGAIMKQRLTDWLAVNGPDNLIFLIFGIIPFILIGAGASKQKWLETAKGDQKKWMVILCFSAAAGIFLKLLPIVLTENLAYQFIAEKMGGPVLSFAYIALILLITNWKWGAICLKPLAAAGRMSLTVYLLQSIIGTLIFYHYGLDLYGQVTIEDGTYLAIGIYFILVILADCWFLKFRYGPLEKIWRSLTYGSVFSKRKETPAYFIGNKYSK